MLGAGKNTKRKPKSKAHKILSYLGFVLFFGVALVYIWAHFPLPEVSIIYELY